MFLGEDLLAWLVLALGGAMVAGNVVALIRPPVASAGDDLARAPLVRTLMFATIGLVAALWALASLLR